MATKVEWEAIKKQHRNSCAVCGRTEKQVGTLEKAHLKAKAKGGSQLIPMCPTCHKKFDKLQLNKGEAQKLGLDWDKYIARKYSPPKPKPKKKGFWDI